ncbi:hypothetical protein CKO28_18785 [Rhodovibrio sodomensis]|uniref:Uncharacterized protein n=1 Tax=Rhodovibrio sodomensis TaxID=1088 RepID=A0ABS1DL49_9PROT|nr:hypothetical protein [Rhodovibrio sodomensis]MBK1670085.1 hypothetical protein [Rhodovibrio sodomensis]
MNPATFRGTPLDDLQIDLLPDAPSREVPPTDPDRADAAPVAKIEQRFSLEVSDPETGEEIADFTVWASCAAYADREGAPGRTRAEWDAARLLVGDDREDAAALIGCLDDRGDLEPHEAHLEDAALNAADGG